MLTHTHEIRVNGQHRRHRRWRARARRHNTHWQQLRIEDQEIDIAACGPVYGLDPQEIFQLLILFGPRASMQEFLANMRRPSRMR